MFVTLGLVFVSGSLLRLSSSYWFCLLVEYSLEDTSWPLLSVFFITSNIRVAWVKVWGEHFVALIEVSINDHYLRSWTNLDVLRYRQMCECNVKWPEDTFSFNYIEAGEFWLRGWHLFRLSNCLSASTPFSFTLKMSNDYIACVASVPVRKKSSQTMFCKQAVRKLGWEIEGTLARRPPFFWKTSSPTNWGFW